MHFMSYITRVNAETGKAEPYENKRKVFISYKHADEEALPLCQALAEYILNELDVAVWYDCQLTAGEEYDREIQSAIKSSDAFILLLTPTVLSSRYIIEREIPLAKENQVAVIPVIAGISEHSLCEVENIVGRIHMPRWFFDPQDSVPAFPEETLKQFLGGLSLSIANKDLLSQAKLFYERGGASLSLRHLTPEQMFIKAYGCLFGVTELGDKSHGIKLMESILSVYGADADFEAFQSDVVLELLCHFYRSDQPELFCTYARLAFAKGLERHSSGHTVRFNSGDGFDFIKGIGGILNVVYSRQWHPEILCYESELSFQFFKYYYYKNFEKEFCPNEFIDKVSCAELIPFERYTTVKESESVGKIVFGKHFAYLQKSTTEERTVDLVVDGMCISSFPIYASFGDVYMIYLAYDKNDRLLYTLHSDFDHMNIDTCTVCHAYRIEEDGVRLATGISEWLKGRRGLPYSPYTFKIK